MINVEYSINTCRILENKEMKEMNLVMITEKLIRIEWIKEK